MQRLRLVILFGTLVVFLYLVNSGILNAERQIVEGTPLYLELTPVDPRSIFQGDFMRINYALEADANFDGLRDTHRGQLVLRVDDNNVAHYAREYAGEALADDERLVNFHTRGMSGVRVGVDSFFFQEGLADAYADARYAEVRLTSDGTVMLIDLVGENLQRLVP